MDQGPAVAGSEDGLHEAEAAQFRRPLHQFQQPGEESERVDGGEEDGRQGGGAQVAGNGSLEADVGIGLHPPQVVERDHPARRQIGHVTGGRRRPGQAGDQGDDDERRGVEVEGADDGHGPEGDPNEADAHHPVDGQVQVGEFGDGKDGVGEDAGGEADPAGDPQGVEAVADGEEEEEDADDVGGGHGEAEQRDAGGEREEAGAPEDEADHEGRP